MQYWYSLTIILLIISLSIKAEVTLDGTLGRRGALPGPDYFIGADLGQQHGGNLFHSFQYFNLQSFESATFYGPNSVQNVISRVTGGNPSNIDGLIRSTIPNADMYFLNPYGIMFGPNAQLDVQGSFHASTADYLRLGNGGRFDARQPNQSLLTVAPIEAFGFLNSPVASISVEGRGEITEVNWDGNLVGLSVRNGKTLSLIGNNIEIKNGTFFKTVQVDDEGNESTDITRLSTLSAPSGQINLASVASQGEVIFGPGFLNISPLTKQGYIHITDNSLLRVSGEGGGRVFIRGEQISLINHSVIEAQTQGNQDGSTIDIQASALSVTEGSLFDANTYGAGEKAVINIQTTDDVIFSNASVIATGTYSKEEEAGDAGTVLIEAKNVFFEKGSGIYATTLGKGDAGKIIIRANELVSMTENSNIYVSPFSRSTGGNGGTLLIEALDVLIAEGTYLSGTTFGPGKGGHITIRASGKITLSDANTDGLASGIFANSNPEFEVSDDAGDIVLEAKELTLEKGAIISSSTIAKSGTKSGDGGNITIRVTGPIKLSGVNMYGENEEGFGAGIYVRAKGDNTGQAGNIFIEAETLSITDGAVIASTTEGLGQGGDINILMTDTLLISGDSANIVLREPARAQINFKKDFLDSSPSNFSVSGIHGSSESANNNAGQAGNITVSSNILTLTNGSFISTSTQNAGGGNITVRTPHLLYLQGGEMTSSVQGGTGDGGNITISHPVFVVLDKGKIKAQADEGRGGDIRMTSEQFIASNDSLVSASSRVGIDGEVKIDSPEVELSEALLVLPADFVDASGQLKPPCTATRGAKNSFIVKHLAGSPPSPYDWQSNRLVLLQGEETLHQKVKSLPRMNTTAEQYALKAAFFGCRLDLSEPARGQ